MSVCPARSRRSIARAALAAEELEDRARQYVLDARAPTTLAAYDGDWRRFCAWCRERGQSPYPAPPEAVLLNVIGLLEVVLDAPPSFLAGLVEKPDPQHQP